MRKTVYFCDKCNRQLPGYAFRIYSGEFDASGEHSGDTPEDMIGELCPACYDATIAAIKACFAEGHPDKPKPAKQHGGHNRKPLDLGKIAALRNAGWSFDKIGEEVGCSGVTIAKHMDEAQAFLRRQNLSEDLAEALEDDIQEA